MLQMILTASVLILLVIFLRYMLRGKISLRLQYALWLLVAARLLVPVTFGSSEISVLNFVETAAESKPAQAIQTVGETWLPVQSYADAYEEVAAEYAAQGKDVSALTDSEREELDYQAYERMEGESLYQVAGRALRWIWLAGAVGMALWFLGVNVTFRRKLKTSCQRVEMADLPLPVYVSDMVPSPCLWGLFRPVVCVTPACLGDESRLRHVLAHEYTHYRHGDHIWSVVRCLCLTLYWFHPLVWWAAALSRRDCELACDEGALARLGESERASYGRTLIGMTVSAARPGDLLAVATTMSSGKSGLKERVMLIARKPKMLAITAVLVALICALAVACTFTGAAGGGEEYTLPEELEGVVALYTPENPPEWGMDDEVVFAAYHIDSIKTIQEWGEEPDGSFGWICTVRRYDQAQFERVFLSGADTSGLTVFARDKNWYYIFAQPTDAQFALAEHYESYHNAQMVLWDWMTSNVLSQEGVEPYTEEDYLAEDYTYDGPHYDVKYYPYLHVTGDKSIIWTLVLSQPADRGGIWCVEREYIDGQSYLVRPDTVGTAEEYYTQLQADADNGEADWALDPLQVCVRFVKTSVGHEYVHEDNFELGELYEGHRNGKIQTITAEEAAKSVWDKVMEGETVTLSMTPIDGKGGGSHTVPTDFGNLQFAGNYFDIGWNWYRGFGGDTGDYTLKLTSEDGNHTITCYGGLNSVCMVSDGVTSWYSPLDKDHETTIGEWLRRFTYDEAELAALQQQMAVVVPGEEGWPEDPADVPGYVAFWLSERHWRACTMVTPGSVYELADTVVESIDVYDISDWTTQPTELCFNQTMAIDGEDLEHSVWQAGAGLERGDGKRHWLHYGQIHAGMVDGVWRILDSGTGGYYVTGHDGNNYLPDLRSSSNNTLMAFILYRADGAYSEGASYELGQRFLRSPDGIFTAMAVFKEEPAMRWPDFQGSGAQWLAEFLVTEFTVFRGSEQDEEFLRAVEEGSRNDAQKEMAQLVLEAYEKMT